MGANNDLSLWLVCYVLGFEGFIPRAGRPRPLPLLWYPQGNHLSITYQSPINLLYFLYTSYMSGRAVVGRLPRHGRLLLDSISDFAVGLFGFGEGLPDGSGGSENDTVAAVSADLGFAEETHLHTGDGKGFLQA